MTLIRRLLMRKKLLAFLIVGIIVLCIGSWRVLGQQSTPLTYQTATAERGTLVSAVSASPIRSLEPILDLL